MNTQIKKCKLQRLCYTIIVGILFIISLVAAGQTQEQDEKGKIKTTTLAKEVQGEIGAIGKDYITIIYERDAQKGIEYEMWLPIEKDKIKLVHKRSLEQLNIGDIVRVQYEEITEEYKEGPRLSRKAKVISFVKPAPQKPEQTALESEFLTIKGIKGR